MRKTLIRILDRLSAIDLHQVRFIPEGADDPRLPVPDEVEITPADVERAVRKFNEWFPDYAGLLDADVREQRDF